MIVYYNAKTAESNWLHIGSNYAVQAIYFSQNQGARFRIISEDNATPAMFAATDFTVVDSRIPETWRVHIHSNGDVELSPKSWLEPGFWVRFFDGDADARHLFDLYTSKIGPFPKVLS